MARSVVGDLGDLILIYCITVGVWYALIGVA